MPNLQFRLLNFLMVNLICNEKSLLLFLRLPKRFGKSLRIKKLLDTPDRKFGIRCGNRVESFGGTCKNHDGLEINEWLIKLLAPDVILLKTKINPNWFKKLKKTDSLVIKKTIEDIEKEREIHRLSSEFWKGNSSIHDGIEIFWNGLQNVKMGDFIEEIQNEGYYFSNFHFEDRYWEIMKSLIVVFSRKGTYLPIPSEIADFLSNCSWGFVHVFVNPPKMKDGKWFLIHSVHLSHRTPPSINSIVLKFEKGIWNFK